MLLFIKLSVFKTAELSLGWGRRGRLPLRDSGRLKAVPFKARLDQKFLKRCGYERFARVI